MFEGSETIRSSRPRACIARRVLSIRMSYSVCSNGSRMALIDRDSSGLEGRAGATHAGALGGQGGDRGILRTRAGQVTDGDLAIGAAPASLTRDHLAELGEARIGGHSARRDGMMQLAECRALALAIADVAGAGDHLGRQ